MDREVNTILAALRLWQRYTGSLPELEIARNGGQSTELSREEIDKLCEDLNYGRILLVRGGDLAVALDALKQ